MKDNQKIIERFVLEFSNLGGLKNYRSTCNKFINHINGKELLEVELKDIESFLNTATSDSNYNDRIAHLVKLYDFIKLSHEINFDTEVLKSLRVSKKEIDKNTRPPMPLNLKELIMFRETLDKNKKYKWWFTFEIAYFFGIKSPTELSYYNLINYNYETRTFNIKGVEKGISSTIGYIIDNNGMPSKKLDKSASQYDIKEIENLMGRPLQLKDLNETHNRFFFNCPNCNHAFENVPENWVILEHEKSESKWLVCRNNCASNLGV